MKTLEQYLEEACKDYTYANVKIYKREPNDSVPCIKQVSGSIDFVSNYFKKDPYGNHLIHAGYFNLAYSRVRGNYVTCACTYRLCDTH